MGQVYLFGLIDDYFPDYQFGCGFVILLNDSHAQKRRWIPLFLLNFSGVSVRGIMKGNCPSRTDFS